jgi:ATP-dependent helicase YprA (DUF1998 family)
VHAALHCLINVLPLIVACSVEDMQAECAGPPGTPYKPRRLLLYDPQPGGLGISKQVYDSVAATFRGKGGEFLTEVDPELQ